MKQKKGITAGSYQDEMWPRIRAGLTNISLKIGSERYEGKRELFKTYEREMKKKLSMMKDGIGSRITDRRVENRKIMERESWKRQIKRIYEMYRCEKWRVKENTRKKI